MFPLLAIPFPDNASKISRMTTGIVSLQFIPAGDIIHAIFMVEDYNGPKKLNFEE